MTKEFHKPIQTVLSVAMRQSDACLIKRSRFERIIDMNPSLIKSLRVILESDSYVSIMLTLRSSLEESKKEWISKRVLHMNNYPRGKDIMKLVGYAELERVSDVDIQKVKKLLVE